MNTDTQFARDWAINFYKAWVDGGGTVPYSHTIRLQGQAIKSEEIRRALNGVPTHDPRLNSRIILLAAHPEHAIEILKEAANHRESCHRPLKGIGVRVTECRSASPLLPTVLVRSSMCWIEADVSAVGVRSCGAVVPAVGDAFLAAAPILTSDCCRSSDGSGIG